MLNPQQTKQFEKFADDLHELIKSHGEKKVDTAIIVVALMTQCKVLSCLIHPTYEETKGHLQGMMEAKLQEMHQQYAQMKAMIENGKEQGAE